MDYKGCRGCTACVMEIKGRKLLVASLHAPHEWNKKRKREEREHWDGDEPLKRLQG